MNSQQKILLVTILAVLGFLALPLSQALASSSVARVAERELAKKPAENGGDNIPRYKNGRGAVAPYSTARRGTGLPWSGTFVSVVMQRAGYKQHLRGGGTLKVVGGRAVGYVGTFVAKARKAGKLRSSARPGYLAVFGDNYIAVVSSVSRTGGIAVIGGNLGNRVARKHNPSGITGYIAPW